MLDNMSVDNMTYGTIASLKLYAEQSTVTFTVKLLINARSLIDAQTVKTHIKPTHTHTHTHTHTKPHLDHSVQYFSR